ncbi:MAG: hypothetical protein HY927_11250, partial [Elusimicrobia bacterium]|nr:hypothetical protein [Elusimicrobiota bacterium]
RGAALTRRLLGGRLPGLEELEKEYGEALPGVKVERLNGMFALARWARP